MTRRRTAFTLIELLVVVAIIAVLSALAAGALFRVRESQREKLAGDTVAKLQRMLAQQVTATYDTARATQGSMPDVVKNYAQLDPDRAKAIWAYLHLRKNFPQTVNEARSAIVLGGVTIFPAPAVFLDRIPLAANTLPAEEQSAICLYVSLVELNRRGMESGITDSMVKMWPPTGAVQTKVFTDTFNTPVGFRRYLSTAEMAAKPFVPKTITASSKDPLDPFGKLTGYDFPADLGVAIGVNGLPGSVRMIPQANGTVRFPATNFIPSVISYGLNKKLDVDGANEPNGDDLLGYRLMVEGRTGN